LWRRSALQLALVVHRTAGEGGFDGPDLDTAVMRGLEQTANGRLPAERGDAGPRLAPAEVPIQALVRTLQRDLIPRLAQVYRPTLARLSQQDVVAFGADLLGGFDEVLVARLDSLRKRGFSDADLCLDLLAPVARWLGELWEDDRCDFATVTIAVGQLQRLMRRFALGSVMPLESRSEPLSILLLQPPHETHSFGLSMVAEFFRAAGWQVVCDVGHSPALQVAQSCFDAVGLTCGCGSQLDWLRQQIPLLRAAARNDDLVVMVGGPVFARTPNAIDGLGADLCVLNAQEAPVLAERQVMAARSANSTCG
jgi:methanogenic corrinoid protein MtbC1